MTAQLDDALAAATLSGAERRTLERFVTALEGELGEDLRAAWLYGSRARGERAHPDSDVDILVIAEGGHERHAPRVLDLSEEAADFLVGAADFVAAVERLLGAGPAAR